MALEYYDISKEQKSSITRAKKAMENLGKNGLEDENVFQLIALKH